MGIEIARQKLLDTLCNIIYFLDGGFEKLINLVANSLFINLRINNNSTNKIKCFFPDFLTSVSLKKVIMAI